MYYLFSPPARLSVLPGGGEILVEICPVANGNRMKVALNLHANAKLQKSDNSAHDA